MTALLFLAFVFTAIRQLLTMKLWSREGQKEQTYNLVGTSPCHILFLTKTSSWFSLSGKRWAEKEMASYLSLGSLESRA